MRLGRFLGRQPKNDISAADESVKAATEVVEAAIPQIRQLAVQVRELLGSFRQTLRADKWFMASCLFLGLAAGANFDRSILLAGISLGIALICSAVGDALLSDEDAMIELWRENLTVLRSSVLVIVISGLVTLALMLFG
jgi:hypothetical protein